MISTVITQLSILFVSVIQKRVQVVLSFDADTSDLLKYVFVIFIQFLGPFYNRNPGCTLENPKWAERGVILNIWHKESCRLTIRRGFQTCIPFYCAIIGVSYTGNCGYTLENLKWAERLEILIIWRRNVVLSATLERRQDWWVKNSNFSRPGPPTLSSNWTSRWLGKTKDQIQKSRSPSTQILIGARGRLHSWDL